MGCGAYYTTTEGDEKASGVSDNIICYSIIIAFETILVFLLIARVVCLGKIRRKADGSILISMHIAKSSAGKLVTLLIRDGKAWRVSFALS